VFGVTGRVSCGTCIMLTTVHGSWRDVVECLVLMDVFLLVHI
jgi:hypothetical protein